jgi:predicted alpha/beta superfamily hydrolase
MLQKKFSKAIMLLGCLFLFAVTGFAQITFRLKKLPAATPTNSNLYLAGNFNNWNPADPAFQLTLQADGTYQLTKKLIPGNLEYKFTRGAWSSVEVNVQGQSIENRSTNYQGLPLTIDIMIENWQDFSSPNPVSTASANVKILDEAFNMPQLGRKRRIWVYLPPDYAQSNRHYPVLYIQDGQNVFDTGTSFAGEWYVDETLDKLYSESGKTAIIVAIDNGGTLRMSEYSPWKNARMGGGEGKAYLKFMVETLKPYIDQHFRTEKGPESTGIMGSSMGGLIALYGALEYPQVFGKAGVFSPSLWFSNQVFSFAEKMAPKAHNLKIYLLAGKQEPEMMGLSLLKMSDLLHRKGFSDQRLFTNFTEGKHNEAFWGSAFPAAFNWLF